MRSEFKSATQIYASPIYFEIHLILGNDLFFAYPDLMTKIDEIGKIARNSFIVQYLRSEFKSATQIYVNPISFEFNIEKLSFFAYADLMTKIDEIEKMKFFHRVIFAFWIQICNPNLCKSHTFWNTANIEKLSFFAWWPKLMKKEKLPEILSWGNFCVVNSNLQPKFL